MSLDQWGAHCFSLTLPEGPGRADMPRFLRWLADSIEAKGDIEIQDIVFAQEIDDEGNLFPRATVYYHRAEPETPSRH